MGPAFFLGGGVGGKIGAVGPQKIFMIVTSVVLCVVDVVVCGCPLAVHV